MAEAGKQDGMGQGQGQKKLSVAELEQIAARFEDKIRAAHMAGPATKDAVKQAIQRKGNVPCPTWAKRLSQDVVVNYGDDLADIFCEYPDELVRIAPYDLWIGHQPADRPDRVNMIQALTEDAQWTDEWGTGWAHSAGGTGAHQMRYPISDWSVLDDYIKNQLPKATAPGRFDPVLADMKLYKNHKYLLCRIGLLLYERLNCLRGVENVLTDVYTNEKELCRLCDAIFAYDMEMVRQWAALGADGLFITEDWGTQNGLIISPVMWRRLFKHYYEELFAEAHKHNLQVILHSCGNVMEIVKDFIDIGLDVLDPIQPTAMDIQEVAREFGGHISFCGGVDARQMLPGHTPQQVKDMVRRTRDTLGKPFGNGLILSPDNVLTPELPLENIRAMAEACHE
jgi:uroporphyrinogen decarboxylase